MLGVSSQDQLSQGLPRGGSLEDPPARVAGSYIESSNLENDYHVPTWSRKGWGGYLGYLAYDRRAILTEGQVAGTALIALRLAQLV